MMRGVFDVFPSPSRNLFAGLAILALVLILAFMSRRRPMPSVGGSDRNTFRSQAGAEILFLLSLLALFVGIVGEISSSPCLPWLIWWAMARRSAQPGEFDPICLQPWFSR
jgi:hypothetical protein